MRVMRRDLEIPRHFACVLIYRNDGRRIEIRSLAALRRVHGVWIRGAVIIQVQLRVVGALNPGAAASVHGSILARPGFDTGFTRAWRVVMSPLNLTSLRIARLQ